MEEKTWGCLKQTAIGCGVLIVIAVALPFMLGVMMSSAQTSTSGFAEQEDPFRKAERPARRYGEDPFAGRDFSLSAEPVAPNQQGGSTRVLDYRETAGTDLLAELAAGDPGPAHLMLVGHEPDFSLTVGAICGGGDIVCKKGSLARVDLFLDRSDGLFWINEVNTMPGFTPSSMFPRAWAATGLDYPALVDRLLATALRRPLGLR